jgi:hypothetical protein
MPNYIFSSISDAAHTFHKDVPENILIKALSNEFRFAPWPSRWIGRIDIFTMQNPV